jgi:hypothetical protein
MWAGDVTWKLPGNRAVFRNRYTGAVQLITILGASNEPYPPGPQGDLVPLFWLIQYVSDLSRYVACTVWPSLIIRSHESSAYPFSSISRSKLNGFELPCFALSSRIWSVISPNIIRIAFCSSLSLLRVRNSSANSDSIIFVSFSVSRYMRPLSHLFFFSLLGFRNSFE